MAASVSKMSANEWGSDSPLHRNQWREAVALLIANVSYWMLAGAYTPFLSSYFTSIGLSATQTGMLLTIQPLSVIFVQPLWARLSDRSGKRKLVLGFLVAAAAASTLLYYIGVEFFTVMVATIVFSCFFSALLPLCDAMVVQGCFENGVEFARVRMGGTLGYAFVVFAIGSYIEKYPQAQFAIVIVLCFLFLCAVAALPRLRTAGEKAKPEAEDGADGVLAIDETARAALGVFKNREIFFNMS